MGDLIKRSNEDLSKVSGSLDFYSEFHDTWHYTAELVGSGLRISATTQNT